MNPGPQALSRLLQQALAHHQAGRFAAALPLYRQAQRLAPQNFDAWHLGGTAALQLGDAADAAPQLAHALRLRGDSALALLRLGIAQAALGRLDEAAELLKRSAVRDPRAPEPWEHLASVERRRGRLPEAIQAAQAVCALKPASPEAFFRVCHLVSAAGGMGAALPLLEDAARRWPDHAEAWKNLGTALANLHRPAAALDALERASALRPDIPGVELGLGLACQEAGLVAAAVQSYERVLARDPTHPEAGSARLICLHYLDTSDGPAIAAAARAYGLARPRPASPWTPPASARPPGAPLRVAVVSPDLRRHAVSRFFLPLLSHLPAGELEIHLFHDHPVEDDVSAECRRHAAGWTNLAGLPHETVRDRLRAAAPDVLLDLAGHTGFNRLPVFAERVAPTQVTYLGYPGTTGLAEMDFRFTDAHADPVGLADALHTERLVRFAPCAWAFDPPAEAGETAPPAPCPDDGVTFGSFNTPAKLSDTTLRLWADVLRASPRARLLLKGHGFDDPRTGADWLARLATLGCDPTRVELVGRIASARDHLALYGRVDIALDPFPYHGTTTTCEALWMGRPVVVLAGAEHRSRVGVSLLHAAGHPEWIAYQPEDYIRIAAGLAADPALRRDLAAGLRADLARGPLLDHAGRARDFAAALRTCRARAV